MSPRQRLILVLLLVLAVVSARWLARGLERPLRAEEYLPADTVLFVHWNDFSRFAAGVADSPIVRRLAREDFPETLEKLGLNPALGARLEERLRLIRSLHDLPLAPLLLRNRGMLALLPNRAPEADFLESVGANLVFILSPDAAREAARLPGLHEGQSVWGEHQGATIRQAPLPGGRLLYFCRINNLVLCAFAADPLTRCLDQALRHKVGGAPALAERAWPGGRLLPERPGEFFAFADLRALGAQPRWGEALTPLWPDLRPRQATLAHSFDGRVSGLSASLRFDPDDLAARLARHGLAAPVRPPLAASRDRATMLHLWSNWCTGEVMGRAAEAVNATDLGRAVLAGLGAFLGELSLNPGDFYQHFDPELGLVIRGERNPDGQVKPLFALYARALDAAATRARLRRLVRPFPLHTQRLAHGAEATAIGMAGGMVQPAFVFVGDHLVLADNLHMAQRMEDQLQGGGETPPDADGSARRGAARPADASFYLFLRSREAAEAGAGILRYLSEAKNERGAALLDERQRLFVRELALPFMATLGAAEHGRFALAATGEEARLDWECRLTARSRWRGLARPERPAKPAAPAAPAVRMLEGVKKAPPQKTGK